MTTSDLTTILDRLETFNPERRQSDKRARLSAVRDRLISLHARGHSWRAIARELSATGEKISADLLRAVCGTKAKRRTGKGTRILTVTTRTVAEPKDTKDDAFSTTPPPAKVSGKNGRFGAKGLRP